MDGRARIGGYEIYRVKNVDEACALYASYPATSENRVFADTGGRIAWHVVGDTPIRKRAPACSGPRMGSGVRVEDEPLPYDALPHA